MTASSTLAVRRPCLDEAAAAGPRTRSPPAERTAEVSRRACGKALGFRRCQPVARARIEEVQRSVDEVDADAVPDRALKLLVHLDGDDGVGAAAGHQRVV